MPTYVQHEVLARIPDVFNAEAIWQAPGLALFARRPLLRDLLERSPREQRGRAATRCFSHITLRLPQEEMDDDYHLTRGCRARELAETLASLHQKDFGDLLGNDQVRYDIAGADDLAPGEVAVRFGHAVYLPAPGERAQFTIATSRDGALWKPVCPVYAGQRLALLGGSAGIAIPGWPFGDDGAVLLINDGPDAEPVLQMRPKDAFDCSFDASLGAYAISARPAGSPRLLLKIAGAAHTARPSNKAASAAAPDGRPAVWQARAGASEEADAGTAVPQASARAAPVASDATFAPSALQRMTLVALALPRLSRYRSTGAIGLDLPFSAELSLLRAADAERALTISIGADDELYAVSASGRQRIALPATLQPAPGRALRLLPVPPAMAERYSALLVLADTPSVALPPGASAVFGRGQPALSALRVLDASWMLHTQASGSGPAPCNASPDRIGLSRQAFRFLAEGKRLAITRESANQALYHLDETWQCIASVGDGAAAAPFTLAAGQHLVAGHYVLRFDA
jgi:hypothetical protein